jgi:very-short-patch-repair endonuclease
MHRDRGNNRALKRLGWTVVRVWESDVIDKSDFVVERIVALLKARS